MATLKFEDSLKKTTSNITQALASSLKQPTTIAYNQASLPVQSIYQAPAYVAPKVTSPIISTQAKKTTPTMASVGLLDKKDTGYTSVVAKTPTTTTTPTKITNPDYINTSADEAELASQYQSVINAYNTQKQQLEATYGLNSQEYAIRLKQLDDEYALTKQQLDAQQSEQQKASEGQSQEAYISKMQAQRVAQNILSAQGLANTGYENIYERRQEGTYTKQQSAIANAYQDAVNQINRSREAQALAYGQNVENVKMAQQQTQLAFQQNLQNIAQNQAEALRSYQSGLAQVKQNATYLTDNRATMFSNVTSAIQGGASLKEIQDALTQAVKDGLVSEGSANDIARYAKTTVGTGR